MSRPSRRRWLCSARRLRPGSTGALASAQLEDQGHADVAMRFAVQLAAPLGSRERSRCGVRMKARGVRAIRVKRYRLNLKPAKYGLFGDDKTIQGYLLGSTTSKAVLLLDRRMVCIE